MITQIPSAAHLCQLVDQFLPEEESAVREFLQVLERFVDFEDNDATVAFESIRDHAIQKTVSYQKFVRHFLGRSETIRQSPEIQTIGLEQLQ